MNQIEPVQNKRGINMNELTKMIKSGFIISTLMCALYLSLVFTDTIVPLIQFEKQIIIEWFREITIDQFIGILFVFVLAFISAGFYKNDTVEVQGKNGKIKSPKLFKLVYKFIQFTTIVVAIFSFLTDWAILQECHSSVAIMYTGLAIASIAMALFVSAKLTLGTHYSPCYNSYIPNDIVQLGLYKHIRHPIYTANIMLFIGVFISTGSMLIIVNIALLVLYYVASAIREEHALVKIFPEYLQYMKHTGMFFPSFKHNIKTDRN